MKTLALVAVIASLAFAANLMADNNAENSKAPAAKVQTTPTTTVPTAKMDMSKGCNMPMDHSKSGGCCGM